MSPFTGTLTLLRFALRRDRVRLAVWVAALALGTLWLTFALAEVYRTDADRHAAMVTMNSPAGLAFTGPAHYFSDYTLGPILSHQLLGFVVILVGIMSVLTLVRHTRTEEETGRAELIRACVVGRYAPLASALVLTVLANLALMLLLAVLLPLTGIDSITWSGSLLYGASHAAVGITFAALAAVAVQLVDSGRGASGIGMAAVGAAYLARAAGDAGDNALSWASPIGWAQQTFPYLDDRWWPLALNIVAALVLSVAGFALSRRRDLGAGMRAPGRGRTAASAALRTPLGLALRLHRGMFIGFAIGVGLLGLSYGPFLGDIESSFREVAVIDEAMASIGGATFVDNFLTMITTILAVITTIYVVMAVQRARSEEASTRGEQVLATWQSRPTFLGSHLVVALVGGPLVLLLAALLLALSGAPTVDQPVIAKTLIAALVRVPALWVFAGIAALLIGWLPRASNLAWLVVAYAGFAGWLGRILRLPEWTDWFTPFAYVPDMPAEEFAVVPVIGLTLVAALLIAAGIAGLRRRDVETA